MYIYNAKIHTMSGQTLENGYIRIENGKIAELSTAKLNFVEHDFDCKGADLYPGFIDSHTHLGMIEDGLGFEGDDSNEETDPITPHLRAIDAINPMDDCFKEAVLAGITTVVTGPGSANPISGELVAIKTHGRRIDDMLIGTIGMKFALGENPKTVYNDKNVTPVTRMATAALIREAIFKAKKYDQDIKEAENDSELDPPDFDIKCEALLPLVRKEVKAHFHCHRADDIFTAIRIAKEFDIDFILIHATEGHLVADILGREGVSAVVGPIICDRSKPEMKQLSTANPLSMWKNGVEISLCTDHPVIPVQYLPMSAAVAVKAGLPFDEAMKSITINAAKIVGISDRVGSIEVGKDADFALFDGNPLEIMSQAVMVMINGEIVVNNISKENSDA